MIYVTSFKNSDKQITAPSVDSGLSCINQVVAISGHDYVRLTGRMVIYGHGEERVVFSDFKFT